MPARRETPPCPLIISPLLQVDDVPSVQFHFAGHSYFGALLCVAWSSDGAYIVTGGEDDLVRSDGRACCSFPCSLLFALLTPGHSLLFPRLSCHVQQITVWCPKEKALVARGEGHQSYVNDVAFDPFQRSVRVPGGYSVPNRRAPPFFFLLFPWCRQTGERNVLPVESLASPPRYRKDMTYRIGSVGQDASLALWDFSTQTLR